MMKCKIAHNEDITIIFLFLLVVGINCSYLSDLQSVQELCSSNRYLYTVKQDEPQQLKLTYDTTAEDINKWYRKSKRKCRKEFKTNNGASHFVIVISNMSIPSCSEKCQCNYFEITEPGYTEKFCGEHKEVEYFESKSDYLSIDFHHGLSMRFEVTLSFSVERNTYIITGLPRSDPHHYGHFVETPYFPNTYQSDYTSEYFFHSDASDGRVMLIFLDFQIAPLSYIEVVGHNGTIPKRLYGNIFRPPVFVSQYNELQLKFQANKQPGNSGFRAISYFLKDTDIPLVKPYTDCGGSKLGFGGSIILEKQDSELYDCLWHIVTPLFSGLAQTKSYFLTIANISLINIGPKASLEFREGRNSKSKIVKNIECNNSNCSQIPLEITVSADNGLYVRFTGNLNQFSYVGMVYSTYHIGNCSISQSNCQGRCLMPDLICDGLKQCPDGSDELECTKTTSEEPTFPPVKKEPSISEKAGTAFNIFFSLGICGILIISAVIFIFVFKGSKRIQQVEHADHSEVINEMSGPLYPTQSEHSSFDYLPSYEDFIQSSDRYPPLLYTRAAKRNSEPYVPRCTLVHTTSFCGKAEPRFIHSAVDVSIRSSSLESLFTEEPAISPEPSCSFEQNNSNWPTEKLKHVRAKSGMKRAWSSDSKLDELNTSDCHLHLSITHCVNPHPFCRCPKKQYYSLPINFKVNNFKPNSIDIILQKNSFPKREFGKSRHLSLCYNTSACDSKILTIKTRCHSDPCQFSVRYSLHH